MNRASKTRLKHSDLHNGWFMLDITFMTEIKNAGK